MPRQPDDARLWLTAIAKSSNDAIVGKDPSGVVTSWNKAAEGMFGYSASEMIGQPITRIIPLDRIDEEAAILDQIRRGEKIAVFETDRQRKDGTIIYVAITVAPIRDDQGRIIGLYKIARDLTEIQRAHRDLQHREALLRSAQAEIRSSDRSARAKAEFLAMISSRDPLAAERPARRHRIAARDLVGTRAETDGRTGAWIDRLSPKDRQRHP